MPSTLKRKSEEDSTTTIPDRLYFKIGDVARICGVEAYVLRFWESQFPQLKPNKSGTGQRLYRRRDVELVLEIKELVHGQGFTLAGARQALGQKGRQPQAGIALVTGPEANPGNMSVAVQRVRTELRAIAAMLADPEARPPQARRRTRFAIVSGELFPN
jgi:DNA-binding transcriptional MerR regulator